MDSRLRTLNLNLRLENDANSCWEWCQKQGLQFDAGARLAHILSKPNDEDLQFWAPDEDILPEPSAGEAAWRRLVDWRHPKVNLNLLQLALIFHEQTCIEYLWHPAFLREEDYRDESSKLVNHPLHLSFRLNQRRFVSLDDIREELFYEEGLVDLTPRRILKPIYAAEPDYYPGCACDVLYFIWKTENVGNSGVSFSTSEPTRLAPLLPDGIPAYTFDLALIAVLKLAGRRARPSTVELVRDLATDTSCLRNLRMTDFMSQLGALPPSLKEETLILLCQCTWIVADTESRAPLFRALPEFFKIFLRDEEVHIEKAARFLSKDLVENVIVVMEEFESSNRIMGRGNREPLASQVLKDMLANRNLQDHCVLAIMEAVRGDARKVWSLDQLAELAEKLFHLPFQTTYQKLMAAVQG